MVKTCKQEGWHNSQMVNARATKLDIQMCEVPQSVRFWPHLVVLYDATIRTNWQFFQTAESQALFHLYRWMFYLLRCTTQVLHQAYILWHHLAHRLGPRLQLYYSHCASTLDTYWRERDCSLKESQINTIVLSKGLCHCATAERLWILNLTVRTRGQFLCVYVFPQLHWCQWSLHLGLCCVATLLLPAYPLEL